MYRLSEVPRRRREWRRAHIVVNGHRRREQSLGGVRDVVGSNEGSPHARRRLCGV